MQAWFTQGVNLLKLKLSLSLIFYTLHTEQMSGDKTPGIAENLFHVTPSL